MEAPARYAEGMTRFILLAWIGTFLIACGGDDSSDIGTKGTGGSSGSGGATSGGSGGASSGGSAGAASGGSAGAASGGAAGASSGGAAGASGGAAGVSSGGSAGAPSGPCHPEPSQDAQCVGKPPHAYGCFNGAPYEPPAGCVNIYIGNATDFWCCP